MFRSGEPRIHLRQPAFVPQSRDYGESRGFGVKGYAPAYIATRSVAGRDVTDEAGLGTQGETKGSKGFRSQVRSGSIFVCFVSFWCASTANQAHELKSVHRAN